MSPLRSPSKKFGRNYLSSFAYGIAFKFACSAEHYAWLAHLHRISEVNIDLLTMIVEPEEFDIERNRILAAMCRTNLLDNVRKIPPPFCLTRATLSAFFGIDDYAKNRHIESKGKSVFTVIVGDEHGRAWQGEHIESRMLIQA